MKRILFGFMLGLLLSSAYSVTAQEPAVLATDSQGALSPRIIEAPSEITHVEGLTLRDAIEVLADYELAHPRVPMREDWYGLDRPG